MKKNKGFTLIELLIVVAIVATLSIVATSGYRKQTMKAYRTDAKNKLYEIMQRQEKYMSENNTYTTTLTNLGYSSNPVVTDGSYYNITATAGSNGITDGVILTAAPQGTQVKDTDCGSFVLNSNGQKSVSTSSTNCW